MAKVMTSKSPLCQNVMLLANGVHYSTTQPRPFQSSLVIKTQESSTAQAVPWDKLLVPTEEGLNSLPTSVISW